MKVMCQDFPIGWLDCLFGLCGVKTETLAVVCDFTIFFTGNSNTSGNFLHSTSIQIVYFSLFSEFLELQQYGRCSNCYRLSCSRQILFLMHCFACFDEITDCIGGISYRKVTIRYIYNENTKLEWVYNST